MNKYSNRKKIVSYLHELAPGDYYYHQVNSTEPAQFFDGIFSVV